MANLRVLRLGGNLITDAGAAALAASPYLTNLRRLDLTPLFQVWFVHQNTPREADARGVSIEPAGAERASKFDLTLYSFEDGDTIHLSWHYDAALWDAATIDELA